MKTMQTKREAFGDDVAARELAKDIAEAPRFELNRTRKLAEKFVEVLRPSCQMVEIVGSIRRLKPWVKDIEILLVSRIGDATDPTDMFGHKVKVPMANLALKMLLDEGIIRKRLNKDGHECWGEDNKLAVHVKSGTPVDFFFTTMQKWHNSLVVRTGPTKSNKAIAGAALKMGWEWHAYGDGFTRGEGIHSIDKHRVESEADAFHFVGLPYLEPEKR